MIKSSTAKIFTDNDDFYSKYHSVLESCSLNVYPNSSIIDFNHISTDIPFDIIVIDNETGKFPFDMLIRKMNSNIAKKLLINVGAEPPSTLNIPFPIVTINPQDNQIPLSLFLKNTDKIIKREKAQLELSSMLLHDVRSPLNSLIGYLELLINGTFGKLNEGHKNILEKAIDMGDTALDLLEELHEIFREEQDTFLLQAQSFDFVKLLESVLAIVWVKADKKNIQIKKEINPVLKKIYGDDFQIQRLLTNLLSNAIKYSPDNSKIILEANLSSKQYAQISVADTGQGVPDNDLPHLFDKYFRVKKKNQIQKGYGLGLYICKIIIKAHQGKIWADNNEYGGLTVNFTLPLAS
jgi:signal transduction histidine kinase